MITNNYYQSISIYSKDNLIKIHSNQYINNLTLIILKMQTLSIIKNKIIIVVR